MANNRWARIVVHTTTKCTMIKDVSIRKERHDSDEQRRCVTR